MSEQYDIPIQPVSRPILCSPYVEPTSHWVYDIETGAATETPGRRPASYWYKDQKTGTSQQSFSFAAQERSDDLPQINALRDDVRRWREAKYEGATPVTKQLLAHWNREDRPRRLFFCQREAVETVIYLTEILASGKKPRWTPKLTVEDYQRLSRGEKPSFVSPEQQIFPTLIDQPNESGLTALTRYGSKMATGSGKTVVMSMLVAWAFCNRGRVPGDERFPGAALIVCPNLTVKERLQVLRPDNDDNYYSAFDIVPSQLMPEIKKGKVLVTNWHQFAPESPHAEGGKSYVVVNKGEESPEAFARRVLGDLYDRSPLMVLNDEAHHAYRPAPIPEDSKLTAEEKAEREEATVWISGLDRINKASGIRFCVDLSATPFYLQGSGYIEGSPFPWLVSDFGLVDAIESGIVKIPRLPVSDTTGRPEAKYFKLWEQIRDNLQPGEKLPGGKPKPEVVWREAEDALQTLASQWKERYEQITEATPDKDTTPPVMIIVCDNTDIAALFYKNISGEETIDVVETDDEDEGDSGSTKKKKKKKQKVVYGHGKVFPELFSNREGFRPTLRIDSKLLNEAESEDPNANKKEIAEQLRKIIATVGKPGQPGEQVRCVVSVQMLTEGWDANNVTHILGLRAFGSQLLCEQVVGRGLRRMDYTPEPETGLLTEEYVDVYGIPFSVIPFKGRKVTGPPPDDRPKNHVKSLPARKNFEIRFPVVEGFAFALNKNLIKADIGKMELMKVEPAQTPTAVFVKPQVGYQMGKPTSTGSFEIQEQDRQEYYDSTHLQTIKFEIARQVVAGLTEGIRGNDAKLKLRGRHQLFPQVLRLVEEYVTSKVNFHGVDPRELGLQVYLQQVVERLVAAIEPNESEGEPPLVPILNRYKKIGSTKDVDFKTVKPCFGTQYCHINLVAADTKTWEQSAAFRLEQAAKKGIISFYAKNDHMEFVIPYEFLGVSHPYIPDFLVRLKEGTTLVLEIKGHEDAQDLAKHQAAKRWVSAVNNWGELGHWAFHVCKDPQMLLRELEWLNSGRSEWGAKHSAAETADRETTRTIFKFSLTEELLLDDLTAFRKLAPRYIQTQIFQRINGITKPIDAAFVVGNSYTATIRIGPQDVAWLNPDEKASFPDELLRKGEKNELTVFFSEPHHLPEVQRAEIVLPSTGASTECCFDFRIKSNVKVFEGRILVTYRNRILQTALLTGGVVEHEGKKGKKPKLTAEVVLSSNLQDIEKRVGFDLAMVINHNADNRPRLTKLSGGTCLVCDVDGIKESINVIRTKLEDVTTNAPNGDLVCALMSPETRNLLYILAAHGRVLFDAIVTDQVGNNWLTNNLERVQLVSARTDSYLPIEFIYNRPVPTPGSTICPKAAESLTNGVCRSCLIPDGSTESEYICPIGFWGLNLVIERHAHDRQLSNGAPQELSTEIPPLKILRNCLFAASDKVDSVKKGLSSRLLKKINKVTGNSGAMVKSWPEWRQKIEELQPSFLLLVPHTLHDETLCMPVMEIGKQDRLASVHVTAPYVRTGDEAPTPVVALLGCETVVPFAAYMGFVPQFRRNGAALVLATLTSVLGRQVVPIAEKLLEELKRLLDEATEPVDFGDVLLNVRRKSMLDGMPVVLSLVGYGDVDWKLAKGV